jgi:hypothetical protein
VLEKMTPEHHEMYTELVNPSENSQPADWLCKLQKAQKPLH